MKNMVTLLLFALLCVNNCFAYDETKVDSHKRHGWIEGFELHGNVAYVIIIGNINNSNSGVSKRECVYKFNDNGDVIETYHIRLDGKEWGKTTYSYDKEGNIVKEKTSKTSPFGPSKYKYEYADNLLIKEKDYDNGYVMNFKRKHYYNDKGLETMLCAYNFWGKLVYREINVYDECGLKIESTRYSSKKNIEDRRVYTYYDDSSEKSMVLYNIPENSVFRQEIERNSNGDKIKDCVYLNDQIIRSEEFTYDSLNRVIENKSYDYGILSFVQLYTYDDNGNVIESCRYDSDNKLVEKRIMMYDEYNNMVSKSVYEVENNVETLVEKLDYQINYL